MEKKESATEKVFDSPYGTIHYWAGQMKKDKPWLVFLPGLTADHHLFDKQIEELGDKYNYVTWDAPAHGKSRPFELAFTMDDMAQYLHAILEKEMIVNPVLIGQSLGGYIAQVYMDMFPKMVSGFISIDSAPMKRKFYSGWMLACLHHTKGMYLSIPWKLLINWAASGMAVSTYGRQLMRETMEDYTKKEYCELAGYGFHILADAVGLDRGYQIDCPTLLLCGEKDQAGFVKSYDQKWAKEEGYQIIWLPDAGHNANTDEPQKVNQLIEQFVSKLGERKSAQASDRDL